MLSTSISSFGGGTTPALQSLALALVDRGDLEASEDSVGVGGMFGAISVLQAIGQNIVGVSLSDFHAFLSKH